MIRWAGHLVGPLRGFYLSIAMHLVQILLPSADNTGQPFDRQDFDRVKEELAAHFEGVTAYLQAPAEGLWREGGQTDHDNIVLFEVMAQAIDLEDWRRRRTELEILFRQDKVVVRYMPMALV